MDDVLSVGTTTVALGLAATVLTVVVLAAAALTRPLWAGRPHLAPAYGLLGLGISAAIVLPAWLRGTTTGTTAGAVVLAGCALVVAEHVRRARRTGELASLGREVTPVLLLVAGVLLCTMGLFLLWGGPADVFALARDRFSHPLPIDNELPSLMAGHLLAGEDPRVPVASWLTSDRPPLQTGLLLLVGGSTSWAPAGVGFVQLAATSIVVQLAWVPASWALGRALGFSRRAVVLAVAVTGLSGTVLVNTVFTWPKLLSAAFVLAALAVLVDLSRGRRTSPRTGTSAIEGTEPAHPLPTTATIAALCTFGMLSHGAAVFAFPVVAVALWWARRATTWRALLGGAAVAVLLYLPWVAYQRFYDPPGDRLLKWHLAGAIDVDQNSVLHDIVAGYSALTPSEVLSYKILNLQTAFALPSTSGAGWVADMRGWQFFALPGALGLVLLPLTALAVAAVVARVRGLHTGLPAAASTSGGLLLAALVGILLWCLILFGPATAWVHAGSHVPILLAAVLATAWLADVAPRSAWFFAAAQVAVSVLLYLRPGYPGSLHLSAVALAAVGALALGAAWTAVGRSNSGTTDDVSLDEATPATDPMLVAPRSTTADEEAPTTVRVERELPRLTARRASPTAPSHRTDHETAGTTTGRQR